MVRKTRKLFEKAGYTILLGCCVGLLTNIAFLILSDNISRNDHSTDSALSFSFSTNDEQAFESSLMIDSILSIIQSYYVDPSRVDNGELLLHTLEALALHPSINVESKAQNSKVAEMSPRTMYVLVAEDRVEVKISKNLSYQDLIDSLVEVSDLLNRKLPKKVDEVDGSITTGEHLVLNALLQSLDAHSALLSKDAYNELRQGTEGAFGGLGVVVGVRNDVLTVLRPLPKSPAFRAGLEKFDKIISIDGKDTYGFTLDQLVEYMRGSPGTPVILGILRDGEAFPRAYTLKREMITVESVSSDVIKDSNHEYLWTRIESFSSHTSDELADALSKFTRTRQDRMDGLVLDLRSNPGGLLDQAIEVANLFIESGVLVSTKGRRSEVESAHKGKKFTDFPIVLLMNEDSASASEIVAGALQDHQRAVVIGQPSFGKGSVQTIFELPGQQALKLTIARYYTPLGKSIQNVGIQPDIWLQPLIVREENRNLLGMYRYRNERFLRNRLEAKLVDKPLTAKELVQSFKAYYKADKDPDDFDDVNTNVPEMAFAKLVLREVRAIYPGKLSESNNRSTHWLAIAAPSIKAKLSNFTQESHDWLMKKHQITWGDSSSYIADADLQLSLPGKGSQIHTKQGDEISIPWRIKNVSNRDMGRLSLYVTPISGAVESTEVLVGTIGASSQKSGVLKVRTPKVGSDNHAVIRVGVASDAVAVSQASESLEVDIDRADGAILSAFSALDDQKDTKNPGVLDAYEQARLRIEVKNVAASTAHNVKATVRNLSGTQLKLKTENLTIGDIGPGESRVIYVDVEGGSRIFNEQMSVGIVLQGEDLQESLKRTLAISAAKNASAANVYGH